MHAGNSCTCELSAQRLLLRLQPRRKFEPQKTMSLHEGAPAEFPAAGETAAPSQNAKAIAPPKSTDSVDFTTIDQLIEDGEDVEANFQLSNLYWKQPESQSQ